MMMFKPLSQMLRIAVITASLQTVCNAIPQATTASATPTPSMPTIPWTVKIEAFRDYVSQQPDMNATRGFWNGPSITKTFDDGECLQVRYYNWVCDYDIPYKIRGVMKWFDELDIRNNSPIWDPYRYYSYGGYIDPDDGWNYESASRLTFGACGNRGPQSTCGVQYCKKENGELAHEGGPQGQSPWIDPNDRNRLCPWLRSNATASHTLDQ